MIKLNLTKKDVQYALDKPPKYPTLEFIGKDWLTMYAELDRLIATIKEQGETIRLLREDAERLARAYDGLLDNFALPAHSSILLKHAKLIRQLDEEAEK